MGRAAAVSSASSPSRISEISAACEAQHAQAGQLALALGQRDARRVVHDAERDDARKDHVEEDLEVHVLGQRLAEIPSAPPVGARRRRRPASAFTRLDRAPRCGASTSNAAPESTSPSAAGGAARRCPYRPTGPGCRRSAPSPLVDNADRPPFEHLDRHGVAAWTPSISASSWESTSPDGGRPIARPATVDDPVAGAASTSAPVIATLRVTVPDADTAGHEAQRLDVQDAGQVGQSCSGARRARLDERHGHVLPLRHRELRSIRASMTSTKTKPTRAAPRAKAMPMIDATERTGWRSSCAAPCGSACVRRRRSGVRPGSVGSRAGGSGRIASAGGMRTARRTAD